MPEAKTELSALEEQLQYHEAAYRRGEPEISDAAFDELFDRYTSLADDLGIPEDQRLDGRGRFILAQKGAVVLRDVL